MHYVELSPTIIINTDNIDSIYVTNSSIDNHKILNIVINGQILEFTYIENAYNELKQLLLSKNNKQQTIDKIS